MTKKEKCKEIMLRLFGPATARKVDDMTEENCVEKCRKITKDFLGEKQAAQFDEI